MTSSNAHVLVVDDEPELRELLTDALSATGLRVTAADSGRSAIASAAADTPDFIVTDLRLGDCTGLDVLDQLRRQNGEIPAVVITGCGDPTTLTEASTRRPVELMTKPLDIEHLQKTIHAELDRRAGTHRWEARARQLCKFARRTSDERDTIKRQLGITCEDLTNAYRNLSGQLGLQKIVLGYQNDLLRAKTDDDVFRYLFRIFVRHSGPVHGMAMVCDASAQLKIVGRFGVPYPDQMGFCEKFQAPIIDKLLAKPKVTLIDAMDNSDMFDQSIYRRLVGVSLLAIPLIPVDGEMIGVVILYRKAEQPFLDTDIQLGEMISHATALAVQRNG